MIGGSPGSRSGLLKTWRTYKPVAALAAAMHLLAYDPEFADERAFSRWIGQAEFFRRKAEAWVPKHGEGSILDPATGWKLPPWLDMGEEEPMPLPPPDSAAIARFAAHRT